MRKTTSLVAFALLAGCAPAATRERAPDVAEPASAPTVVLLATQASDVMQAHGNGSNGGRGVMTIQHGPHRRALIQFALDGVESAQRAVLALQIDPASKKIASRDGTTLVANLMSSCDGAPIWLEGPSRRDSFYCAKVCSKDEACKRARATQPGVTWRCPLDRDTGNTKPDCPVPDWSGAEAFIRPPLVTNDPNAPSTVIHQGATEIRIDVTPLIQQALACGDMRPTLIVWKQDRDEGKIRVFANEAPAALCACNETALCERGTALVPRLEIAQ